MNVSKRLEAVGFIGVFSITTMLSQSVTIDVRNTAPVQRVSEPVVIAWSDLAAFHGVAPQKLRLVNIAGESLPLQVDDMDGDGMTDELTFVTSIAGTSIQRFTLTADRDTLPDSRGPLRVDAANFKRVNGASVPFDDDDGPGFLRSQSLYPFDGVGWESEIIGYRLYLDERNAVDIQAKRFPSLQWNFIGRTGVNYQLDAYWGMDVLHVGSSFGFGGIALLKSGVRTKPLDLTRRRTRILARGPVRVVVLVEYFGWKVGDERVDVSSTFSMYANDRISEQRVQRRSTNGELAVATGIVRHAGATVKSDATAGYIMSTGQQSRRPDSLAMILAFPSQAVIASMNTSTDAEVDLSFDTRGSVRILQSAVWQGEREGPSLLKNECAQELQRIRLRSTMSLIAEIH